MASISRLGRAISSGNSVSDNSCASSRSVSSAVWSSRLAKSAAAVVIQKGSRNVLRPNFGAGQSLMWQTSSIPDTDPNRRKRGWKNRELSSPCRFPQGLLIRDARTRSLSFAHCPLSAPDPAGAIAAALSGGAVLSRRSSGLDFDGLALAQGGAGVAAMGRSQRHVALTAAHGGGLGGREVLQPSRRRLGCAARGDGRCQDGEVVRGGSTITQQVAKNLFLWPGRSVVRKGLELPLSMWIDLVLGKQRVLEIYLNIAELGPSGQFGVGSGAAYAFGKPASELSPREAALLAAILPNPVKRSARNPGPGVRRLAGIYMARAQAPALQRCWAEKRGF